VYTTEPGGRMYWRGRVVRSFELTIVWITHSRPTRSVLGRSSSDVRDGIVFHDLFVAVMNAVSTLAGADAAIMIHVHRLMLVLGEDGIVGFEIILFQEFLSVSDLHIKKRVT
jgi:hypothetical protein